MPSSSLGCNSSPYEGSNPSLLTSKSLRAMSQRASSSCSFEAPTTTFAIVFLKVGDFNFQGCGSSPFCKYTCKDHMSNCTHKTKTVNMYINSPSNKCDIHFLEFIRQKKGSLFNKNQTHLSHMDLYIYIIVRKQKLKVSSMYRKLLPS